MRLSCSASHAARARGRRTSMCRLEPFWNGVGVNVVVKMRFALQLSGKRGCCACTTTPTAKIANIISCVLAVRARTHDMIVALLLQISTLYGVEAACIGGNLDIMTNATQLRQLSRMTFDDLPFISHAARLSLLRAVARSDVQHRHWRHRVVCIRFGIRIAWSIQRYAAVWRAQFAQREFQRHLCRRASARLAHSRPPLWSVIILNSRFSGDRACV